MEVDILATGVDNNNKKIIIYIEAKTDPNQNDINEIIKHIKEFPIFFGEYKGWEIIGVIAGIKINKGVRDYAEKCGLIILAPSCDTMKVLNSIGFKPKVW